MTTFGQLVGQVRQQLLGFSLSQESVSVLTADMASSAGTFQADGETINAISRGLVEIDDELLLVKKWDQGSGTVTVLGGTAGRGAEGTTATTHATGTLITSNPAFPKARIKEEINRTIQALYPHLMVFSSTELTKSAAVVEYELPTDVSDVWYLTGQLIGPSKVWQPLPNWRYNPKANTTAFPSGKSLEVLDAVTPGQKVRVVYAKPPTVLSASTDDFTLTGYPERMSDLVVYGTCKRMLPALEAARLQQQAVEATERAPLVPPASASKAASLYASLYAERLEEERALQFAEVPNYAYFQGS